MRTVKALTVLTLAFALGASGAVAAQPHDHNGQDEAAFTITLNDGAKWQGDQNMITGMTAIHATMGANLDAVHDDSLSPDAAATMAAEVQDQVDFMVENCVLEPAVDEQFHVILGEVLGGISSLNAGEVDAGAVTIVRALNAYGEHFEHPGWQSFE